ncbi:MAG: caspase family protein [Chloroflexales bacterium]|nr:caspase family protein [Chloroflexales bacterium]
MTLADAARMVLLAVAPLIAGDATATGSDDATDTATEPLVRDWEAVEARFRRELSAAERAGLARAAEVVVEALTGQPKAARALDYFRADPQDDEAQHILEGQMVAVFRSAPDDLTALANTIAAIHLLHPMAGGRAPLPSALSADGVHFSYGHALIIGVDAYANQQLRAAGDTAANDARALATLLRDPRLAAYPEDHVHVLVDGKATRDHILDALEELAYRVDGGTALIYFAGHGELLGDSYALLPYDADLRHLAETALTAEIFQRRVAKVRERARQVVVLLNCCHAGAPAEGGPSGAAPPPAFYRPLASGSGQAVISASRPAQQAGARSHANSMHTVFGVHLLDALGGKAPGTGVGIGVLELFAHLRANVPADARYTHDHGQPLVQEPLMYAGQIDDDFVVALRPGWHGASVGTDPEVRRLAELELQLEACCSDVAVPPSLVEERDRLIGALAR